MDVKPCRGCGACHKTGQCVIKDDFKEVEDALLKADGIVLASPNYIFSVTAQMKALMDRCSCPIHCQAMEGKYGAAVVTSGGSGSDEVEGYLLRFLRALGCWTVGSVAAEAGEIEGKSGQGGRFGEARDLGARMVEAIRAAPDLRRPGIGARGLLRPDEGADHDAQGGLAARVPILEVARQDLTAAAHESLQSWGNSGKGGAP